MSNINPYEAPLTHNPLPQLQPASKPGGLFRDGNRLVMHVNATLPTNICIKTSTKAEHVLKRSLSWHHPAVFLVLFLNLLIYAIVAVVMSKKAKIVVGLSDEVYRRRKMFIIGSWFGIMAGAASIAIGISDIHGMGENGLALFLVGGFFGMIISAIAGLMLARVVWPAKITDTHIYLNGVSKDFLAQLPDWQGPGV